LSNHESSERSLLVKASEAAKLLDMSRAHFYRMLKSGRAPAPVRLGGCVRWRVDELRAWVSAGMPPRQRWGASNWPQGGEG
jgi:excisionase family DNA binding protein